MYELGRQKNIRDVITPPISDAYSVLEWQIADGGVGGGGEKSVG